MTAPHQIPEHRQRTQDLFHQFMERNSEETAKAFMHSYFEWPGMDYIDNIGLPVASIEIVRQRAGLKVPLKIRGLLWFLRAVMSRTRATWNDYYLMLWVGLRSRPALEEVHFRYAHLEPSGRWEPVVQSIIWAVNSYATEHPEFKHALEDIERDCPRCKLGRGRERRPESFITLGRLTLAALGGVAYLIYRLWKGA